MEEADHPIWRGRIEAHSLPGMGPQINPPLSNARKKAMLEAPTKVEVHFPSLFLPETRIEGLLRTLATERRGLHRKRLIWSIIGMPITVPFMLVPM